MQTHPGYILRAPEEHGAQPPSLGLSSTAGRLVGICQLVLRTPAPHSLARFKDQNRSLAPLADVADSYIRCRKGRVVMNFKKRHQESGVGTDVSSARHPTSPKLTQTRFPDVIPWIHASLLSLP